jgi:hypothetical protein
MGHRGCGYPPIHHVHSSSNRSECNPQARELVADHLVYGQRLRDLSCRLQSAEAARHLLMTRSGEHAVPELGQGYDADGDLVGKVTERASLLTRNENRGVEYCLHAKTKRLELVGRVWKCLLELDRQARIGLSSHNQLPRP